MINALRHLRFRHIENARIKIAIEVRDQRFTVSKVQARGAARKKGKDVLVFNALQRTEEFSQLLPIYRENNLHVCSTPKNIRRQQSQDALISVQAKAGGCHCLDASSNEYLIHRVPREPT